MHLDFNAAAGFVRFAGFSVSYRPLHWYPTFNESSSRMHTVTVHLFLVIATRSDVICKITKRRGQAVPVHIISCFTVSHLCCNVTFNGEGMFLGPWWSAGLQTCPL